ncbi:hypothetical protein P278_08540 [Zhouia amylolytica AD3]|uniref:Uncharacterized protein n=1 Tax=Zhouia amylolytica AD3 TaxID=1286632 RepID=W2UQY1_9FLAO|nr:hypothetical protein P278_08540 [Zhouia amylolytica AD3]
MFSIAESSVLEQLVRQILKSNKVVVFDKKVNFFIVQGLIN